MRPTKAGKVQLVAHVAPATHDRARQSAFTRNEKLSELVERAVLRELARLERAGKAVGS